MKTPDHSPGPWMVESPPHQHAKRVSDASGLHVAAVIADEANAKLVAAAPELLTALRGLLAAQEALNATGYDIAACQQNDRAEAVAVALLARLGVTAAGEPESEPLSGSV